MVRLSRKFSAPSAIDTAQWKKVQLLVENGFLFQPVYEPTDVGARRTARYPLTFAQAKEFVVAFKSQGLKKAG